jgi:hypothetical protein
MNRKLKGSSMMTALSRAFVLLLPLLFIDALLDIAFFGGLKPLVVPCCMVVYSNTAGGLFNVGCPFCFITYQYPLLWGVIAAYAVSAALAMWSFLFRRSSNKIPGVQKEIPTLMQKVMLLCIVLAVIGTFLMLLQVGLGSFRNV